MPQQKTYIVTGTDTDVGKTVCSALLTCALDGCYWKPIQSGTQPQTDRSFVQRVTGLPDDRFFPEAFVFSQPLSPHRASELDGITIDFENLNIPPCERTLIIEGAGGLLVPVDRKNLMIDLFERWHVPIILCARTVLGTINHTLLSIEALKKRNLPIHGIVFIGDENLDNQKTVADFSGVGVLGRIPILDKIDANGLKNSFKKFFVSSEF